VVANSLPPMAKPPYEADYRLLTESLRQARLRAQRDQAWVAEQLGVTQSYVSKYESGDSTLDVIEFVAVCGVLGLDPAREIGVIARRPRLRVKELDAGS